MVASAQQRRGACFGTSLLRESSQENHMTTANKALHRTAICAWGFALELLVFISQFVASVSLIVRQNSDDF